jgi:hypothetical protein
MDPNPYEAPHHPQEPLPQGPPLEIASGPLTVEFELTVDDYVAFNVSHHARGALPTWTRRVMEVLGFVAVPLAVILYLLAARLGWTQSRPDSETVVFLLIFVAVFLVIYPVVMWWGLAFMRKPEFGQNLLRYYLKRKLSSADNTSIVGHRRVTISPAGVHEQSSLCETIYKIAAVKKLLVTDDYLFIYLSGMHAFLVPKRAFFYPHDFELFVRTLEAWTGLKAVN